MKAGGRGTAGREGAGLRRGLVVAQVAPSLVLVAGAALFSRSLVNLLTVDTGFQRTGILNALVVFQRLNLPPERNQAFKDEIIDRLRAIPGVEAAAITHEVPLRDGGSLNLWLDGADARQAAPTNISRVGPDYFRTLQIPLLSGREFTASDRADTPKAAVVNEAFARKFLNGANPIGQRFRLEAFGARVVWRIKRHHDRAVAGEVFEQGMIGQGFQSAAG
ncbi:MAG: ABC transporter permease [Blastocatellia bacterium]